MQPFLQFAVSRIAPLVESCEDRHGLRRIGHEADHLFARHPANRAWTPHFRRER